MPDPYRIASERRGRVLVFYHGGKRHRIALGTADQGEAERRAPAIYSELTRPKGTTVAALWEGYTRDKTGRAVVGTMEHTWKALKGRFGPMTAETITVADCRAHTEARRAAGIKDGTIHTELGHLRMVLLWAVKQGLIDKAVHIERPAKPAPKDRHLTRAEVRALMDGGGLPHVRLFITLAMGTAARNRALLDLTWDRVDFERGKIDLRNPGMTLPHKGRAIVPMNRTVRSALVEAREGKTGRYVIEWAGKGVASVKRGLAVAAERAGLGTLSPHVLRHTAAVHMAEGGIPMEEIASYLGHRNVNVTRNVYARFSPEHLKDAAAVLEYDDFGTMYQKAKRQ